MRDFAMEQDVYKAPSSDLGEERESPSSRLAHCAVAWISGCLLLPLASAALLALTSSESPADLLQGINSQDLLGCLVAGCVSAASVSPFRRLPLWVAMLAGFVPPVLFFFFAAVMSIYANFV